MCKKMTLSLDHIIETQLSKANTSLGELLGAEVILLRSPLLIGVDDDVRRCVESLVAQNQTRTGRLCVVLETNGGFIEIVERIHNVFRRHYTEVVFVIPNFAYSAGTVLVLSGDDIYMDYYSVLGPIDPQISSESGDMVPGIGYLVKYNQLLETINNDPTGVSTRAEMSLLISKFDPARLFFVEQARDHAIELLKEWLPKYKFKDWEQTETNAHAVTEEKKRERASEIANILGNPQRWHSHGRGISIRELESEEIKLKINNFSYDQTLNSAIREYYNLIMDYFLVKTSTQHFIHSRLGARRIHA
jgi:hypothetical protein